MSEPNSKSFFLGDDAYRYLIANWGREPEILAKLRKETSTLSNAGMQISPEQGQFMAMLARLMGAGRYLEVGVFTGYSSLTMALAMTHGQVVACDVSEEYTAMARRYWNLAGVEGRVDLRLGPATETLAFLVDEGQTFDIMFIDADKSNYDQYYELGLSLVRVGGVIAIDNVFWHGAVIDPEAQGEDLDAIKRLNAKLHDDPRIELAIVPIGDGLTLARRV